MSSPGFDGYISILNIRQKFIRRNLIIGAVVYAAMMLVPFYILVTRYDEWLSAFVFFMSLSSVSTALIYTRMELMLIKSQIELLQELRQTRRAS